MIKLNEISIGYNGRPLFDRFSLEIPSGTFNVIIGANGTGKSTLLQTIGRLLLPVSGNVVIDGRDIGSLSRKDLARTISFVYSERFSGAGLTVRELVEMGRYPYTGLLGRLTSSDRQIVNEAMVDVGVSHKSECFLSDISDGERQKAMIARVLAQQTPVLMLDEPTNYLDAASRIEVLELIKNLVHDKSITALISTHDTSMALSMADNVITILSDDKCPVAIHKAGSAEAFARLDRVFADRNIRFDTERLDFIR